MKIKEIEIHRYKSVKEETVAFNNFTTFVGANGSGKSNFLKALDLFYRPKAKVDKEDFFSKDTSRPIEIIVTYHELSEEEQKHFQSFLSTDGTLMVIKRFDREQDSGKYYGITQGNKDFADLPRKPAADFKAAYAKLASEKYTDLPNPNNPTGPQIEEFLSEWEAKNTDKLQSIESEKQFFGFDNSSASSLEQYTKFVYIPAVLDTDHLEDSKESPIAVLTDLLARKQLKEDEDIRKLEEELSKKYAEKLIPFNKGKMFQLSQGLSETLNNYYQDVSVKVQLDDSGNNIQIPVPKANVDVEEGGFKGSISSVGQGLQRAFLLSLLQYFVEDQHKTNSEETPLNLILGIDEPELYQHPSKQKLFFILPD